MVKKYGSGRRQKAWRYTHQILQANILHKRQLSGTITIQNKNLHFFHSTLVCMLLVNVRCTSAPSVCCDVNETRRTWRPRLPDGGCTRLERLAYASSISYLLTYLLSSIRAASSLQLFCRELKTALFSLPFDIQDWLQRKLFSLLSAPASYTVTTSL